MVNQTQSPAMFSQTRTFISRFLTRSISEDGPLRVCVVGSGPAGFYTAHQLLKRHADTKVDILERMPVPFGLVRYGVAPDHPEVKNCINQFTALAETENCRFIGNVTFGKDVHLSQLQSLYHAIVMAYGAEEDKKMRIPGEDLSGVLSARAFVGWYNGYPSHKDLNPDLSGEVAVIVGHGNVALDVARILLTPTDQLETTDICDHALRALQKSHVRQVYLIGRRGPLQVSFTIKELREMTRLRGCTLRADPQAFGGVEEVLPDLPRPRKRLTELMLKTAAATTEDEGVRDTRAKTCDLTFFRSPMKIISDGDGKVASIRMEINRLEGEWDSSRAVGTGQYEHLDCNLVLRSIGYNTAPVEGFPFDDRRGIIPNVAGRVAKGLYCSGWVKTGPVGVLLNTMDNAFETAEKIIEDYKQGDLPCVSESSDLFSLLSSTPGQFPTTFSDWKSIEREERSRVERSSPEKPREKIVSIEEMLQIIRKGREEQKD